MTHDDIRRRLAAATPGPWHSYWVRGHGDDYEEYSVTLTDATREICGYANKADADLIAHAPDDIATLLADNDRLRAAGDALAEHVTPDIRSRLAAATTEEIARKFHKYYERLAPRFGWATQSESAVPWDDLPDRNRLLMLAVVARILPPLTDDIATLLADNDRLRTENEQLTELVDAMAQQVGYVTARNALPAHLHAVYYAAIDEAGARRVSEAVDGWAAAKEGQ